MKSVSALVLGMVASVAGWQTPRADAADAAGGHVWQVHKTTFIDAAASQPNLVAGNVLLPPGWMVHANGNYMMDCVFSPIRLMLNIARADGDLGILVYPGSVEAWSDNPQIVQGYRTSYPEFAKGKQCTVRPPQTLDAALRDYLGFLKRTPVGEVQPVPGLQEELRSNVAKVNQQLAQHRGSGTLTASGGRMRFTTTVKGKAYEGWLVMIVATRALTAANGGGTVYLVDKPLICEMFARAGELDANEKMLAAMLGTIQLDPNWEHYAQQDPIDVQQIMARAYAQVANIRNQMMQDNLRTQQKIAAIRQGTADYAQKVRANVASDRAAALDHSSQQFSLYMGDQAIYKNPSTGERVQMSSNYGHAWASSGGSTDYVLTDSASYDPNGKLGGGSWTELQQER